MSVLIDRIVQVFSRNSAIEKRGKIWEWCYNQYSKTSITEENLENMTGTSLVYGFFGGNGDGVLERAAVLKLAKALGILGIENPEGGANHIPIINSYWIHITESELLNQIEAKIGFDIRLPIFTAGRTVLGTDRGVISDRHCHYLWLMKRIVELCPDRNSAIIEIGAGLGLLGYFLDRAGYMDYTSIDLANASACQTYFLAKNLPDRNIILSGEVTHPFDEAYKTDIKLLHYTDFKDIEKNRFSLMINLDGFTEMGIEVVTNYMKSDSSPLLLSVNHELNEFRVIDTHKPYRKLVYRYPFWVRDGYVEELYELIEK